MNELLDDKGVIRKLKKEIEELRRQLKGGAVSLPSSVGGVSASPSVTPAATPVVAPVATSVATPVTPAAIEASSKVEEEARQLKEEVQRLQEEVRRREAVEQEHKAEQERVQQQQENLQNQLSEALQRIEKTQEEAERAKEESVKKGHEVEEIAAALSPLQCAIRERVMHRLRLEEIESRDAAWLEAWKGLPDHTEEAMSEALQRALAEITQLREDRQDMGQRLATAESAQATLKRVETEWAVLLKEKESAETDRKELQRKVMEMKDTMEGVLKNVEVLYSTEYEERQKAAALETEMAAVTKERDTLQASMDAQSSLNKALQAQSAMMDQKQRSMKHQWTSEVGQLRKAKEELSKRLGSAVLEEKRLRAVLVEKEASLQSSSQCIQQMRLELHTLQTVIASNDDAIDELEACEVVSNDDLSRLKDVFLRQKQELVRSEKKVKEMQMLNEELMRNVEGKERELNQVECELNDVRGVKREMECELNELKQKMVCTLNDMKRMKQDIEKAVEKERVGQEELKAREKEMKEREKEMKEREREMKEREKKKEEEWKEQEREWRKKEEEWKEKEARLTTTLTEKENALQEKEAQLNNSFVSTVEHDSPSTMSESVLHGDRPTAQALQEDNTRLQAELAESQDRVARLQQTIRSKYAEYKQMRDTVKEAQEAAARLSADFDKLQKKYAAAKTRIAHLEKSKLSTSELEKIKQLLKMKEAMSEECQGLRAESKQLHDQISSMNEEMTSRGTWRE